MKVLMKRANTVTDGILVQLGASNIVEPLSTGVLLGVASQCRVIQVQDNFDVPVESYDVCDVVMSGDSQAILEGDASAVGGLLYPATDGKVSVIANGEPIGRLAPRALSALQNYNDGELVNVSLF